MSRWRLLCTIGLLLVATVTAVAQAPPEDAWRSATNLGPQITPGPQPNEFAIDGTTLGGGETCATATVVTYAEIAAGFHDTGATGATDDCAGQPYRDVWYRYDCICTGSYTLDMCSSPNDTYMKVWSGSSCCVTLAGSNDDGCGGLDPTLTITLAAGTTYWFECGNYSTSTPIASYFFNATTTCSPVQGACCFPDGSCQELGPSQCNGQGGVYQGDFTTCVPNPCPQPNVRCCFPDGHCEYITAADCAVTGGSPGAYGTNCDPVPAYAATRCSTPFEDISATGTHVTAAEVDDGGASVFLPFSFPFYGNAKTSVGVTSNGYLTFGTVYGDFSPDAIPNTATPNDLIAVLWRDLNALPSLGGAVQWEYRAGPNRFIVQWTNVPCYNNACGPNTFQAILYDDGCIELRYLLVVATGYQAGVENAAGDVGTNVTGMVAPGICIRLCPSFDPPCPQPGACCVGPTCLPGLTPDNCAAQGGIWQGLGSDCFPNPCAPTDYWWDVTTGEQGGTGWNGQWIYYPDAPDGPWYNMWWPNEYDPLRHKRITITFTLAFVPGGNLEAAFVWAIPGWQDPTRPPLPNEEPFIQRQSVGVLTLPQTYTFELELPFCPSWVSLDIRGNGYIIQGTLEHICLAPPTGACCIGPDCLPGLTQADCAAQGGIWQGAGTDCFPNPCVPTDYWWDVTTGEQGGTGWNGQWIYYPDAPDGPWYNMWWPNEYDPSRHKRITLTFNLDLLPGGALEAAFVWSTLNWQNPDRPPLPDEEPFIQRQSVGTLTQPNTYTFTLKLPYCPSWVSLDVRGNGYAIDGIIEHICLLPGTGACCVGTDCLPDLPQTVCLAQGGIWQGAGTDCFPNPCRPVDYYWDSATGEMGGTGWNGAWIEYPNAPSGVWWNMWWPNEYDLTRQKVITITFSTDFAPGGRIEIALNWSIPPWQNTDRPPLADEEPFIERSFAGIYTAPGQWTYTITLPYCPAWVSLDVRGQGYRIQGVIEHICLPGTTGACCLPGYACTIMSEADCLVLGGRYRGDGAPCGDPLITCGCVGDCNCDGVIDFDDINSFVAALSGAIPCNLYNCDINGDGVVDFDDINGFVALLSSGALCP